MQLILKVLTGALVPFKVEPNSTIEDLKKVIEEQFGVETQYKALIFEGKN